MTILPESLHKLYPFENHFYKQDHHKQHYIDEGKGETIIMVHGNPTWSFYYRNLVLHLRNHYRCIVPDHIGCGLSDKPSNYPYQLETHINNLENLVTHLGIKRFHLIVHDWGGPIGLGIAFKNPQRLMKLVILNTAAFLSSEIPLRLQLCRAPLLGTIMVRGLNLFSRLATRIAVQKKIPPEVKSAYLFPYNNWENRIAVLRFIEDIPLHPSHSTYRVLQKIETTLSKIQNNPALICWGGKDFVFTEHFFNRWKTYLPHAQTHHFPDAGHYILEDVSKEIPPLISQFFNQ